MIVPALPPRFPRLVRTRDRPGRISDRALAGYRSRKPKTGLDPGKPPEQQKIAEKIDAKVIKLRERG